MALIKHGNNALSSVTAFPSAVPTGKPVLLSTATASSSSSIEFTLNSSYDISYFEFINIHPDADRFFKFNFSTDNGSTYSVSKTTTFFKARHYESGASTEFNYEAGYDLANSTADMTLTEGTVSSDNDSSLSGYMHIFNPSSSVYVKHFLANINQVGLSNSATFNNYIAGYANTTSALTNIKFVMTSGTIDAGTIKMYGIS